MCVCVSLSKYGLFLGHDVTWVWMRVKDAGLVYSGAKTHARTDT